MSGLDLLEAEELVSEPVKEPAKRWRNWWRSIMGTTAYDARGNVVAEPAPSGTAFADCHVWPSKEIAQQRAFDEIAAPCVDGDIQCPYLGAFPDGERP